MHIFYSPSFQFSVWSFIFSFCSQRFPLQAILVRTHLEEKQFVPLSSYTCRAHFTPVHANPQDQKSLICMRRQQSPRLNAISVQFKSCSSGLRPVMAANLWDVKAQCFKATALNYLNSAGVWRGCRRFICFPVSAFMLCSSSSS